MFQSGFIPARNLPKAPGLSGNSEGQFIDVLLDFPLTESEDPLVIYQTPSTDQMSDMALCKLILTQI